MEDDSNNDNDALTIIYNVNRPIDGPVVHIIGTKTYVFTFLFIHLL